jgi:hypothetical protein
LKLATAILNALALTNAVLTAAESLVSVPKVSTPSQVNLTAIITGISRSMVTTAVNVIIAVFLDVMLCGFVNSYQTAVSNLNVVQVCRRRQHFPLEILIILT